MDLINPLPPSPPTEIMVKKHPIINKVKHLLYCCTYKYDHNGKRIIIVDFTIFPKLILQTIMLCSFLLGQEVLLCPAGPTHYS